MTWVLAVCPSKHLSGIWICLYFCSHFDPIFWPKNLNFLTFSPGHCVPTTAIRLGHVALLRWLLLRPEGGRCLPHRGGPLSHHDQLWQPLALLLSWRWGRWGRGTRWEGTRKQTSRERCWETDRWWLRACVFTLKQRQHRHHVLLKSDSKQH